MPRAWAPPSEVTAVPDAWPPAAEGVVEGTRVVVASIEWPPWDDGPPVDWLAAWEARHRALPGEARLLATGHPERGPAWLLFERPRGDLLQTLLAGFGWLDEELVRRILRAVCRALEGRHAVGEGHGEIGIGGPIWFDEHGVTLLPPRRAVAEPHQTRNMPPVSFVRGRAPHTGEPAPWADVWSLALLGYELATGAPYFALGEGVTAAGVLRDVWLAPMVAPSTRARVRGHPVPPPWFDDWFVLATSRVESARYRDAAEAGRAL